mgnify:CR=1 FL=1
MSDNTAVRAAKLDKIFGTPVCAVLLAIFCNVLWGSAFPFIKLGYRLFSIDSGNTASIFCFAGVRFMLGSVLVLLGSILYKFCIQIAINAGLPANMLKFITAVLFLLVLVLVINLITDILYSFLDPRVNL